MFNGCTTQFNIPIIDIVVEVFVKLLDLCLPFYIIYSEAQLTVFLKYFLGKFRCSQLCEECNGEVHTGLYQVHTDHLTTVPV